ncbi:MAG: phage late control D family protein [Rubrivivax sp.]|nr:phage late control D family protein [Rubrivivax sp.]
MATSPLVNSEQPLRVAITHDGTALAGAAALLGITVRRALNQVPSATLVFAAGELPAGGLPLGDSPALEPGAEVTVSAGHGDDAAPIFSGIVVKQGLSISGANGARLLVECRDKAVRMTVGRRSACHEECSDGDILAQLLAAHGLRADVAGATLHNAQLVRHPCTDWNFLLARAAANRCVVIVRDGEVSVAAPKTGGEAALVVSAGEDLIEFDAELEAQQPFAQVHPVQPSPGGRARLRGRMRLPGSAKARLGELFELRGVGERFAGSVLATGLTHRIEDGAWSTEVEFGTPIECATERCDGVAPAAGGRVPGTEGLHARAVHGLAFDDADGVVTVSTPGGNTAVLSDKEHSIVLTDVSGNRVRLGPAGITMHTAQDIRIEAQGAITLRAGGGLKLQSDADVKVEGLNVACEAKVGLAARGTASAELSAAGQTTIKGAMVLIN